MNKFLVSVIAVLFAASPFSSNAQERSRAETLSSGKALFEKKCTLCHSLSLSLSKVKSGDEWTHTVKRMVMYGSPLNSSERKSVIAYLSARSLFERNCNKCHEPTRVVPDDDTARDWKTILGRMSGHLADKRKKEPVEGETDRFSDEDIEELAAFLSVILNQN